MAMNDDLVLTLFNSMIASLIVEMIHDPSIGQWIEKVELKLLDFWHRWFCE